MKKITGTAHGNTVLDQRRRIRVKNTVLHPSRRNRPPYRATPAGMPMQRKEQKKVIQKRDREDIVFATLGTLVAIAVISLIVIYILDLITGQI